MLLTVKDTINWIELMNSKVQENKEYLTTLDQAIGDGDHGINMARGFKEVVNKLSTSDYDTVSDVFKDVAMTLMAKVGGASGPLFGTAFLKMSMATKDKPVDQVVFSIAMDEALTGIMQRGKANEGEKTLVDVWAPVMRLAKSTEVMDSNQLIDTAKTALEGTKEIKAMRGRAAYLKERSIGHLDPGSMSSFYLFESLAEILRKGE